MAVEEGVFQVICFWLTFFILFAVYLRFGLESAMVHHEGTLVSASRTKCIGTDGCQYYVNERFLYANNTRHCTITRTVGFNKKSRADRAVARVELNTTRTIWLKPGYPLTCFDETIIHNNFVFSMVMLSFAGLPCCLVCFVLVGHIPSLCSRVSQNDTEANKHSPVENEDIEMVLK